MVTTYSTPDDFLRAAKPWLLREEARYNLIIGLAELMARRGDWSSDTLFATVHASRAVGAPVAGCVMRTPPHKLLVTDLPEGCEDAVTRVVGERYDSIPAVLGERRSARAVADAWVATKGGRVTPGMKQGIYSLRRVRFPEGVEGARRVGGADDFDRACAWSEAFAAEVGILYPPAPETVRNWLDEGALHLWVDPEGEVSTMAVAHGATDCGARIGYVYTPPERRRRGYASALVASLSQHVLDVGKEFCVLYTDMSNPTSNAIYGAVGYELIEVVQDFDVSRE